MEGGVSVITIHATISKELVTQARTRLVPWTSRGAGVVINDLLTRDLDENVYLKILPQLVDTALRTKTVISLGACFRSANIFDSCDNVQRSEINWQLKLATEIKRAGVGVIIETPGHAKPSDIRKIAQMFKGCQYPIMPLGTISDLLRYVYPEPIFPLERYVDLNTR